MSNTVLKGEFSDELKNRYLTYAMSTIMARALPDVRDGLKPVHRRLLYAMRMLKLDPDKGFKKCARVVGDVIGKYHPHGDQAVYDAMVRLAQDFSVRYPLVDGQGNFGSIDGDGAAAMRYTESRLTEVARWLMKDLEAGTVEFIANYDESDHEPVVFPACFPNLLANGASGIAVGLSTNIPPHNVSELCDGLVALLKKPELEIDKLLTHVKAPDFPTGGVMVETSEAIREAYATGRGSFRLRAKWEKEELSRGAWQIIVTEMPYQVQKSKVVEKIADLMHAKKLPWLSDVRDESAEDIRLVLEPKSRNVDAVALMESLFRQTDLESRISLNMNVITAEGRPGCLPLKDVMTSFLDHRRDVLIKKSKWRLGKIAERLHILDAYKVVYLNIDEVINIIKENDHPAPVLMERFSLDDIQANAILDMRLRRLRKLEEMEIKTEYDGLVDEQAELQNILASEETQTKVLIDEAKAIKKQFGDKRRTALEKAPDAVVVPLEAQVEKEPVTVLLSKHGWIKVMKGHLEPGADVKYKEGDAELYRLPVQSTDDISFISSGGKVYTLKAADLPPGRGFGEPLRLMVELDSGDSIVLACVPGQGKYLLATRKGFGFITDAEQLVARNRTGKTVVNVGEKDEVAWCLPVMGDHIAVLAATRRLLAFKIEEIPELQRGKGVKLMNAKGLDILSIAFFDGQTGFGLQKGERTRVMNDFSMWLGKRAQVGRVPPHGFQQEGELFTPESKAHKALTEGANVAELVAAVTRSEEEKQKEHAEHMAKIAEDIFGQLGFLEGSDDEGDE